MDAEGEALRHPNEKVLRTFLFEVAGMLNSRPLHPISSDPTDLRPLTPNDLFNRPPNANVPAAGFDRALPSNLYRYVQRMRKMFVNLWRGPYLQWMADRKRWRQKNRNLAVGDFVAEIHPNLKNSDWSTGRVVRIYPGADGLIRAVDVQLPTGVFRRGVSTLCLLPPDSTGPDVTVSGENVGANKADAV